MSKSRPELIDSLARIISRSLSGSGGEFVSEELAERILDHVDAHRREDELRMTELVVLAQHYEMVLDSAQNSADTEWGDKMWDRMSHLQREIDRRVGYGDQ